MGCLSSGSRDRQRATGSCRGGADLRKPFSHPLFPRGTGIYVRFSLQHALAGGASSSDQTSSVERGGTLLPFCLTLDVFSLLWGVIGVRRILCGCPLFCQ